MKSGETTSQYSQVLRVSLPERSIQSWSKSLNLHELADDLKNAGILAGDCIILHSSLSSLGHVHGGASTVVEAFIQSVGESGTAVFPAFTFAPEYNKDNPPVFDARTTPCVKCIGVIPEASRTRPGGIRSLHPTHSVTAFGRLAKWITDGHEKAPGPCGTMTPFDKIASIGGKIVMLGTLLSSNTSIHHAEELAGAPFVLQHEPMDISITGRSGETITLRDTGLHRSGTARDYNKFEESFISAGILKLVQVGPAAVRIIDACLMRKFLVNTLLADPLKTLDESVRADWG